MDPVSDFSSSSVIPSIIELELDVCPPVPPVDEPGPVKRFLFSIQRNNDD